MLLDYCPVYSAFLLRAGIDPGITGLHLTATAFTAFLELSLVHAKTDLLKKDVRETCLSDER
jgi:hypothetical protein